VKLFSSKPSAPPASEIDPAWGDEQARTLRAELARGKWQEAHTALEASEGSWDDRQFLVEVLTDGVSGRPSWTEEWTRAQPQSAGAWTMRGAHGIKWGWEARGGGKAANVQDQSWATFWQRLEEAERDLMKAADLDRADPVPWTYLVISARGIEKGVPEINERLKQAHARHPWHHFAFSQALQGFAKKWAGSHELMFDLARQVAAGAPDGASAHTLMAEAHVERWLYMASWDKDEANALTYFRTPSVSDEIKTAATRSVWSSKYERPRLAPFDHNLFAYCFFRMHDWESARRELQAMNGVLNRFPWAYGGNPVEVFKTAQQRILKGE
jgi:hypothetical protein